MAPQIGEPVPVPRVTRRRQRDHDAEEAVLAVMELSTTEEAIPVTGFPGRTPDEIEDAARKFGNRVQGYADRDHDLKVRASYDKESGTLYLTVRPEGELPAGFRTHPAFGNVGEEAPEGSTPGA